MSKKSKKEKPKYYSNGRVKRGPSPLCTLTRTKYRRALPELRRDFKDRCAYCMRHISTETEMQVDHFDPRKKSDKHQLYSNLYLSDAHCNAAKGDTWPTEDEQKQGCRFLDCCNEHDYDDVIFEDPDTHELVGTTVAARYHIEMLDLNNRGLIEDRKYRAVLWERLRAVSDNLDVKAKAIMDDIKDQLQRLIPQISAPPFYASAVPEVG